MHLVLVAAQHLLALLLSSLILHRTGLTLGVISPPLMRVVATGNPSSRMTVYYADRSDSGVPPDLPVLT